MLYVYCRTHRTTPDYQHVSLRHNRDGPLSATSMRTRFAGSSIFLCCCLLYEGMIALQCPSEQLSRQSVCGCLLMQSIAFTLSIAISMKTVHLDHISEPSACCARFLRHNAHCRHAHTRVHACNSKQYTKVFYLSLLLNLLGEDEAACQLFTQLSCWFVFPLNYDINFQMTVLRCYLFSAAVLWICDRQWSEEVIRVQRCHIAFLNFYI